MSSKRSTIFDSYLKAPATPIFGGSRHVLRPEYLPEVLPHREEQIQQIAAVLSVAFKGEQPHNLLIFGKTGTGKTAAIKYVGHEVRRWLRQERNLLKPARGPRATWELTDAATGAVRAAAAEEGVHFLYLNCKIIDTEYGILAALARLLKEPAPTEEVIPFTGWPMERVFEVLKERIEASGGVVVVVLDEIDQYVRKGGGNILYQLLHLNEELHKARLSLIGVSNDLCFTDSLEPRVRTRLGEEKLVFPPYDAAQLADILRARAALAFEPGVLGDGVIPLCAALAAQEHGDARRALHLLRMVGEIAEREEATLALETHVHQAAHKIESDVLTEVIRSLPLQSKLVLLAIVSGYEQVDLTTGQTYNLYHDLCGQTGVDPLTQRRITDLVAELDHLGIIQATLKSLGRGGGRTRMIRPNVSLLQTKQILAEDGALRTALGFRTRQTTLF